MKKILNETRNKSKRLVRDVTSLPKNLSKNISKNISKNLSKGIPKNLPKNISKNISSSISKGIPKDLPKNISRNISKSISKGIPKSLPKNIAKIHQHFSGKQHTRFKKRQLPKLKYGMLHSLFGFSDGVSIVMQQIEDVLINELKIPTQHIMYLVGKSKQRSPRVTQRKVLWHGYRSNRVMLKHFSEGYGGWLSESIEKAIEEAKNEIEQFIVSHDIDVLIAHNSSHPENFISSIALSRYYRDAERAGKKTPKYILWWHDSHLERPRFKKPSVDVNRYLLQGVPGVYVEFILFINSLQFCDAQKYFQELDKLRPGFYENMHLNHDVIYNTTDTYINSYEDLESEKVDERIEKFIDEFKIRELLKERRMTLKNVLFCLQHTRAVQRKRIDFALKYCFEMYKKMPKKQFRMLYFFVSGHSAENGIEKRRIKRLYKKLCDEYKTINVVLSFAEDTKTTNITFEEYPRIFAKLGGFSTYFSEIEGFGNNLLEVMASGLIPVLYTYPVFVKDIAKYKFKAIALNKFEIVDKDIDETIDLVTSQRKRKMWVNTNLEILKKKFPHKIMARKLQRAIIRRRINY